MKYGDKYEEWKMQQAKTGKSDTSLKALSEVQAADDDTGVTIPPDSTRGPDSSGELRKDRIQWAKAMQPVNAILDLADIDVVKRQEINDACDTIMLNFIAHYDRQLRNDLLARLPEEKNQDPVYYLHRDLRERIVYNEALAACRSVIMGEAKQ